MSGTGTRTRTRGGMSGTTTSVAIYGAGQLASGVAARLRARGDIELRGPGARDATLLDGGADLVIIATTTLLADVLGDVERAVAAGSNVLVSAEESAFPWNVDREAADRIDALARQHRVTVLGGGLNPGFLFDALVLTLLGAHDLPSSIRIERVVGLGRFGEAVRGRLGLGFTADEFAAGRAAGRILGHAGFAQSMRIVADALGIDIDPIAGEFEPVYDTSGGDDARTTGFHQTYTATVAGEPWFVADFIGNVDLAAAGLTPGDRVTITDDHGTRTVTIDPGVPSQEGSVAVIANSVDRVIAGPPGWVTIAALPPAFPRMTTDRSTT